MLYCTADCSIRWREICHNITLVTGILHFTQALPSKTRGQNGDLTEEATKKLQIVTNEVNYLTKRWWKIKKAYRKINYMGMTTDAKLYLRVHVIKRTKLY